MMLEGAVFNDYRPLADDELDQRMERWADWARGPSLGFGGNEIGYLRERLDRGSDSHEMTDEIATTERAIARTKMEDKAYWRVVKRYYLGRLSHVEIAMFFHVSEDSVKRLKLLALSRIREHILQIERKV